MLKLYQRKHFVSVLLGLCCAVGVVIVGIIMPTPFWSSKACASVDTSEKALVSQIMQLQEGFHKEHGKFLESLQKLESSFPGLQNDWKLIVNHIPLEMWEIKMYSDSDAVNVSMIARKKRYRKYGLYSEIGRIRYNKGKYTKLMCRSIKPGTLDSYNVDLSTMREQRCPIGTQEDC